MAWLVFFTVCFYSSTLPNNAGISRLQVWAEVPIHLLNLVDPLPAEDPLPSGWRYMPQRFPLLATGGLILFATWGAGTLLLELLGLRSLLTRAEQAAFAGGLGLAGLSLLMLVSGLAGVMDRGLAIAVLLLLGLGGLAVVIREKRRIAGNPARADSREAASQAGSVPGWLWATAAVVVLPFLISILLGSMLPSTDFDVKEYHLQGPKEFYQNGQINFLPHNVYTSFPFLTEMLSLLAMVVHGDWLKGALAGKLVLSAFAPLTALGLYGMGSRWHSAAAGLLAAMIFLTTPWVYRISTIAYAEGGLSCYVLLSLAAGVLCLRKPEEPVPAAGNRARYSLPLLAGLLAGSGMACKYTGLISAVIPVGVLLLAGRLRTAERSIPEEQAEQELPPDSAPPATIPLHRDSPSIETADTGEVSSAAGSRRKRWRWPSRAAAFSLLACAAGVLVAVGPWLLKNLIETGNPVYPLAWTIFGGRDWDGALSARWRAAHSPADYDVWRMLWFWTTDVTIRNDWLSPLLYALAPLAWFTDRRRLETRWLWGFLGWLFLSWWLLTHRLDRFWIPMIPVAALLAGIGAMSFQGRLWRTARGTAIVLAALFNLTIVTSGAAGYNALLIDLDYAIEWTARHTAPGIAGLNQLLPADSLVLCVGEAQVFDARIPLVYNTVFDASLFEQLAAVDPTVGGTEAGQMKPPARVREALVSRGITHIFVNWQEIMRYRPTYGYAEFVQPERFARLVRAGVLRPAAFTAWADPATLGEAQRAELTSWGRQLVHSADGQQRVLAAQLYEVNAAVAP